VEKLGADSAGIPRDRADFRRRTVAPLRKRGRFHDNGGHARQSGPSSLASNRCAERIARAILLADITGSTRCTRDRDAAAARQVGGLPRRPCDRHRTTGGASSSRGRRVLCTFASPRRPLRAAREMLAQPRPVSWHPRRHECRTCRPCQRRYLRDAVNSRQARRVARPGEILISGASRSACRRRPVESADPRQHELQGKSAPTEIYSLVRRWGRRTEAVFATVRDIPGPIPAGRSVRYR